MVHDDRQDVLVGGQTHQADNDREVELEVEGALRLLGEDLAELGPLVGDAGQVVDDEGHGGGGSGLRHRPARDRADRGPEAVVARHQVVEAAPEELDVERPREAHRGPDAQRRGVGLQLLQEPKPLLGIGELGLGVR